jgi:hypothetical protein
MPTILGVRIEDRLLELSSPRSESFGKIFDIDSVNFLLGKNGSGKTKLLLAIANAIAAPGKEGAKLYFNESEGASAKSGQRENVCAIYYSALPYRRKLSQRVGLIDASPRARNSDDAARINRLGEVAAALGVETRLTGVFGYSRSVYRAVLIPALRRASKISDPDLDFMIKKYVDADKDTANLADDLKSIDSQREKIFKELEHVLERLILSRMPDYDRLLYLTALEYMSGRTRKMEVSNAADAFLVRLELAINKSRPEHFHDLEEIVEHTREVLSYYGDPEDWYEFERKQSFQIDGIAQLAAIRRHDTPIRIEWANLSSGLQALVEQFALIGEAVGKAATQGRLSLVILIDEGDAYLHLDWQRRYFSLLNKYLGDLKNLHGLNSLQLILATHSPLLAADVPGEFVTNLDSGETMKTFAAPLEEVIAGSFESSSLGEFAAKKINEIYRRAQESSLTDTDRQLIEAVGDVAIRSALMREDKN